MVDRDVKIVINQSINQSKWEKIQEKKTSLVNLYASHFKHGKKTLRLGIEPRSPALCQC